MKLLLTLVSFHDRLAATLHFVEFFFLSSGGKNSVLLYVRLSYLENISLGVYTMYQIHFDARRSLHAQSITVSPFGSASSMGSDLSTESKAWVEILILLLTSHGSCLSPKLRFLHV